MKDKLLEIIETYYRGWFCPKCKTPYMTKGEGKCECGEKLVFGEDVALEMFKKEIDRCRLEENQRILEELRKELLGDYRSIEDMEEEVDYQFDKGDSEEVGKIEGILDMIYMIDKRLEQILSENKEE